MSEKTFWNYLRENLNIKMYRIENLVSRGMPDVHFIKEGKSGWIELKYSPKFYFQKKISVGLKQEQHLWLKEYKSNKGVCWILFKADKYIMLFSGDEDLTKSLIGNELMDKSIWQSSGKMDKDKWRKLEKIICS